MKKSILFSALSIFLSVAAHAETQLACWNMYSKKGSRPILTANIVAGSTNLSDANFNFRDAWFESYIRDESNSYGGSREFSEVYQPKGATTKETGQLTSELITTNRSPYKGNNQYAFEFGYYSLSTPNKIYYEGTYTARLILPTDLRNTFLKAYRIRSADERSNAVVIMDPPRHTSQSGDNYLRLFCVSK